MYLTELISPNDVVVQMRVSCKKDLLSKLAEIVSTKTGIGSRQIFETLLEREHLGSTGIGNGIAIPHGKFPELKDITGFLAILDKPIDFEAVDDEPVDFIFLLLANDEAGAEHLKVLARIARILRDSSFVQQLREAKSADTVYALLDQREAINAA